MWEKWGRLRTEVCASFREFFSDPSAVSYLAVTLVFGGAAGIWVPYLMSQEIRVDAISTYVFAVLAPLFADFFLMSSAFMRRISQDLRIFVFLLSSIAGTCALAGLLLKQSENNWYVSWTGLALAVLVWIIVMSRSDKFKSDDPAAPVGGERALVEGLAGTGLPQA